MNILNIIDRLSLIIMISNIIDSGVFIIVSAENIAIISARSVDIIIYSCEG